MLLYELLTGRTPFDSQTLMKSGLGGNAADHAGQGTAPAVDACLPRCRRTELTSTADGTGAEPPKLISQIKGDLDWIVMKALEKDRNRRYETANGLAMDIQRFLDNEPVLARPPNRLYRLQKLVRRNQLVFVASGAVALALLLGLGISTWLFFQEREVSQREAQLRSDAEDRARITQAMMFVSQGNFDDANQLLEQVKSAIEPTLDGVSAFRSVGEWMAMQGRWQQAARRYSALIKIDKLNGWGAVTMDYQAYGVVLAEGGDKGEYERFCQSAATNLFANAPRNGILKNGGILKTCLLFPVDRNKRELLRPMADGEARKWTSIRTPGRVCLPPSGNIGAATMRGRAVVPVGVGAKEPISGLRCDITWPAGDVQVQSGQISEAEEELAQGRELVESHLSRGLEHGRAGAGYWYDWLFARLLLRETGRDLGRSSCAVSRTSAECLWLWVAQATGLCGPATRRTERRDAFF